MTANRSAVSRRRAGDRDDAGPLGAQAFGIRQRLRRTPGAVGLIRQEGEGGAARSVVAPGGGAVARRRAGDLSELAAALGAEAGDARQPGSLPPGAVALADHHRPGGSDTRLRVVG